jgi:hypothetical protein
MCARIVVCSYWGMAHVLMWQASQSDAAYAEQQRLAAADCAARDKQAADDDEAAPDRQAANAAAADADDAIDVMSQRPGVGTPRAPRKAQRVAQDEVAQNLFKTPPPTLAAPLHGTFPVLT